MDVPEGTWIFCFQIKGMHCIWRNQHKITGFADNLLAVDIHRTAAGSDEINFDGFVNMLCKTVIILTGLIQCAYDGRRTDTQSTVPRSVFLFHV